MDKKRHKNLSIFFTKNPAYLGFIGAILGVIIGGLISIYSIKYSKKIDSETSRKEHIEQLYLNLEFSFSLFKDGILRYYQNDWTRFYSEELYKLPSNSTETRIFYEKKFQSYMEKIESEETNFAEYKASFYRDYKALKLYIDLERYGDFFEYSFDTCLVSYIDSLKNIPTESINSFDESKFYNIHNRLVEKILIVHKNCDSVLTLINKQVSLEITK